MLASGRRCRPGASGAEHADDVDERLLMCAPIMRIGMCTCMCMCATPFQTKLLRVSGCTCMCVRQIWRGWAPRDFPIRRCQRCLWRTALERSRGRKYLENANRLEYSGRGHPAPRFRQRLALFFPTAAGARGRCVVLVWREEQNITQITTNTKQNANKKNTTQTKQNTNKNTNTTKQTRTVCKIGEEEARKRRRFARNLRTVAILRSPL